MYIYIYIILIYLLRYNIYYKFSLCYFCTKTTSVVSFFVNPYSKPVQTKNSARPLYPQQPHKLHVLP